MNKETIESLFRQHYQRMYRLAMVLLKDDAASKDVVSDVFADVLDGNVTLRPDSTESYLLVCVHNKCLNLLKRRKLEDRVHHLLLADASTNFVSGEAIMSDMAEEEARQEAIQTFMDAELTPQTRKVLNLRFRKKLKYREIAAVLGISEVAVYKHLAQGIKKLKQQFNP